MNSKKFYSLQVSPDDSVYMGTWTRTLLPPIDFQAAWYFVVADISKASECRRFVPPLCIRSTYPNLCGPELV